MSFDEVVAVVSRFAATTDSLAAIGARLGLGEPGPGADPLVDSALDAVLAAAGVPDLGGLAPQQQAMLRAGIRSLFRQAADLLEDPARPPGWRYNDPVVLDGQGRASMMIPSLLAGAAPELAAVNSFLDVGTGVGWLAIAAAKVWPGCTVVGIDPWEPALERARTNVADAGLEDRIVLRDQDVIDVDDVDAYDCAWMPSFFLPESVLITALPKILASLRPGGWLALGRYEPPPDPLAQATMALQTARDGGFSLSAERAVELLQAVAFNQVHPLDRAWSAPIGFVLGQKPT